MNNVPNYETGNGCANERVDHDSPNVAEEIFLETSRDIEEQYRAQQSDSA